MKLLLTIALCLVIVNADTALEKWQEFKLKHGKSYRSGLEEKRRFAVFQDNLRIIDEHNAKYENKETLFSMGVTQFADMTRDEFRAMLKMNKRVDFGVDRETYQYKGLSVNKTIDYVKGGLVTDVKDQGNCGSCWAFSATGVVEGQVAKEKKILKSLSPQSLLDCVTEDNGGCELGGDMVPAFRYIKENGIPNDADYPYKGRQGKCANKGDGWKVSKIVEIPANNADASLEALDTIGPLSMAIDATSLQLYMSGIVHSNFFCSDKDKDLNHGVLAVGAGTSDGVDYFVVKNSWNKYWGEHGYFRIERTKNICGSLLENSYATL